MGKFPSQQFASLYWTSPLKHGPIFSILHKLGHGPIFFVSDMAKGLKSARMALGIQSRECLTHIFHRLQDELDCFPKGKNYFISALFKYAKATTMEEEHFRLQVLIDKHLKPEKLMISFHIGKSMRQRLQHKAL
jgi:hypothetical protein